MPEAVTSPRSSRFLRRALALGLLTLTLTAAAGAEWLVMRDGSRFEIAGEPEVRGAMVVFELPGGTLGSVRLSEVDLEASEEANAAAEAPPAAEEEKKEEDREPVLVLTNKDVARARSGSTAPAGGGEATASTATATEAPDAVPDETKATPRATVNEPFELLHWELRDRGELGVEVSGTLVNQSAEPSAGLQATVRLLLDDTFQAERSAILQTNLLQPGAATTFRAPFPELYLDAPEEEYQVEMSVSTSANFLP